MVPKLPSRSCLLLSSGVMLLMIAMLGNILTGRLSEPFLSAAARIFSLGDGVEGTKEPASISSCPLGWELRKNEYGPYAIHLATFHTDQDHNTGDSALAHKQRLRENLLPRDRRGGRVCPRLTEGSQPGTLYLTVGSFPSIELAYLYALELMMSTNPAESGLHLEGFRLLHSGHPIEITAGDVSVDGMSPPLRRAIVVGNSAPVYHYYEARVPALSAAHNLVSRGERLLVGRQVEACDPATSRCSYWHQVLFGEEHRTGWMLATDLLDTDAGVECPDQGCTEVVYLRRTRKRLQSQGRSPDVSEIPHYLRASAAPARVRFDVWMTQDRWSSRPRRIGRLFADVDGFMAPDIRWRNGRPVVVGIDGEVIWLGPPVHHSPSSPDIQPELLSRRPTS